MTRSIVWLALTGALTLTACGGGPGMPTQEQTSPVYTLTVDVSGVNELVPVTVTHADGTVVGTYHVSKGHKIPLPRGTYQVMPGMVPGYSSNGVQPADLTRGNGTVSFTYTSTQVPTAVLTLNLQGVSGAPVTIKDASGAIVAGYNNGLVRNGETVTLPRGKYTVSSGDVAGFLAPAVQAVDLSGGNAAVSLTYAAVPGVPTSVLTLDLQGVSRAPITIKDASGAVVSGYNGALANDGDTLTLPRGTYTVTGGAVGGFTSPPVRTVDLSGGNATAALTYTAIPVPPPVSPAVLTLDLQGVSSAPITLKDASGAVIAGYNNAVVNDGDTITLPRGTYTITSGAVTGFTAPPIRTVNLSAANTTAVLAYTALPARGVYYIDGQGCEMPVPAADLTNPDRFVFSAWLRDLRGGLTVTGSTVSSAPTPAEQLDVVPSRVQSLAAAYVGYRAADGHTYPVAGAGVRWNILDTGVIDEATKDMGKVVFSAADDGSNAPGFTGGITPQSVTAAGKQADTVTNSATLTNTPFPSAVTPDRLLNHTGVNSPGLSGFTWTTLYSPNDYAGAQVVAVATIGDLVIGNQSLTLNFTPQLVYVTRGIVGESDGVIDGQVPVGGTATVRVTVHNVSAGPAESVHITERLIEGDPGTYRLEPPDGASPAQEDDGFDDVTPVLQSGYYMTVDFPVTATAPGLYCARTTLVSAFNPDLQEPLPGSAADTCLNFYVPEGGTGEP